MSNFASRFGKFSRGYNPDPHWGRAQAASTSGPLGIFSKKHSFHLNFKKEFQWNKCIQNAGKCTISHLDLDNFSGVLPQTPFGEGHKLLLKHIRAFANFHPKKHNFSSRIYNKKKRISVENAFRMQEDHHFASRFGKISRGETPNPLWNGTQVVSISGLLGIFSQRAVFYLNF